MFATLIAWVYQLFIILPFGIALINLKQVGSKTSRPNATYWMVAFLLGLTSVTTLASICSLFINIGWQVHTLVLLLAIILWFILHSKKLIPRIGLLSLPVTLLKKISIALFFLAVGTVLIASTTSPSNPDTGLYHAQAIRWIETYKAVPGLANLHERFGYNSSWLVVNALFSVPFLQIQSFHLLPSTLFIVSVFYFFNGVINLAGGSKALSNFASTAYFIASLLFLIPEISSPGTDLPVTLIIWIISVEWLKLIEQEEKTDRSIGLWLTVICLYCVTIKLTSAPILIFGMWFLIQQIKQKCHFPIIHVACAAFIIFTPFISRNIILSGHLFYPGFSFDPIHVEWSVRPEVMQEEKETIHWFALLPRATREEFNAMTWQEQYHRWFFDQIPRHQAILVYLALVPLVWLFLFVFKKWRTWWHSNQAYSWLILTLYAGILFWLVSAPSIRFGYGFLLAGVTMAGVPVITFLIDQKKPYFSVLQVAVIILGTYVGIWALKSTLYPPLKLTQVLLPLDYPRLNTEPCKFGNFTIECATEWQSCFYEPFPCSVYPRTDLYLRGDDFSKGFIFKP